MSELATDTSDKFTEFVTNSERQRIESDQGSFFSRLFVLLFTLLLYRYMELLRQFLKSVLDSFFESFFTLRII